ncbi:MAG: hypothetical protein U0531_13205 [Dehalococcoidia bacterium]
MTTVTRCAAHPDVETGLSCSRCGTPICPRCMVQMPVGLLCRGCARERQLPMYRMDSVSLARGVGTALVVGGAVGAVWGWLLPPGFSLLGLFDLLLALFIGPPIGYAFADLLDRATRRKRGRVMQGIAVGGLVWAYVVHAVVGGGFVPGDLFGLALTALAAFGAVGRLR